MSKLKANIMLLEFKSTNGLSDKGFDQLLGIVRKMLLGKNELPEKTYQAKQMICPISLEVKKSMRVSMIVYCTVETNTKTWMCASSVKLHGTSKGLLVFYNAHRKFRKRTYTVIAFTQEYSRVSYLSIGKQWLKKWWFGLGMQA
jgi:hypothetical protein